ncbi:MAG: hypothetical protein MZV70_63790 [Desulfobacterales bacterium]|nr:hypothetical protein [Desulfobacterales bacterium]
MRRHSPLVGICVASGLPIAIIAVAVAPPLWAAAPKNRDLVVLEHERWLDTLKGTRQELQQAPGPRCHGDRQVPRQEEEVAGNAACQRGRPALGRPVVLEPGHQREAPRRRALPIRDARAMGLRGNLRSAHQLSAISPIRRPDAEC